MTIRTPVCDLLGIEHPIFGFSPSEQVAAAVSRAGGLGVLGCVRYNDPAGLQAHVRGQLAGYKVPRTIWFVDSVGRTVSGKADYGWARRYVAEHPPAAPAPAERAP